MNVMYLFYKARAYALELLLGLTDNQEIRKVFLEVEMCKMMIRQIEDPACENRELVLQILINLSSDELFLQSFLELNAIHRISAIILNRLLGTESNVNANVSQTTTVDNPLDIDILSSNNTQKENKSIPEINVEYVQNKYIISSENISKAFQDADKSTKIELPYFFMILSNLTLKEDGQKKFLNIEDEQKKGILLLKIIDKFLEFIQLPELNFCSNVIANVSSIKAGRLMILEYKILYIIFLHFDKLNNFKLLNMLRVIRNCCFEYEKYNDALLVKDSILFDYLMKVLIVTNIQQGKELMQIGIQQIDQIYFPNFDKEIAYQEREIINDIIIDIFLILTNIPEAVAQMKQKCLEKAITAVEGKISKDEKIKERLFVIKNYLEN